MEKIDQNKLAYLLELFIVLAFFFLIFVIYAPVSIWEEEREFEKRFILLPFHQTTLHQHLTHFYLTTPPPSFICLFHHLTLRRISFRALKPVRQKILNSEKTELAFTKFQNSKTIKNFQVQLNTEKVV